MLVDELVQDVFVAAWMGAREYRGDLEGPEGWLMRITHRKLLNHRRRMQRLAQALGMQPSIGAPTLDPDQAATERAFTGLPVEQRRVLDVTCQGGLTFTEAARELKIPAGTVESRMNAALTTMRAFITMRSTSP
jgi:RNA polymerase sigma-70 factor (ECF subfamily)